jgi:hypothetical protein
MKVIIGESRSTVKTVFFTFLCVVLIGFSHGQTMLDKNSANCKSKCIDFGSSLRIFCPFTGFNGGYCCLPSQRCPKNWSYCTSDFSQSQNMQLQLCPFNSSICGASQSEITVLDNQQRILLSNWTLTQGGKVMTNGSYCQYKFVGASSMKPGDQI